MREEQELIRAAVEGDRKAFDDLVCLKRERVVRTAYQVTGDWDDALDVAQGVFLKLWQGLERYDASRRFDTWLYRITVNAAIDLIRARGPKGMLQPLPDDPSSLADGNRDCGVVASPPRRHRRNAHVRSTLRSSPNRRDADTPRERGRSAAGFDPVVHGPVLRLRVDVVRRKRAATGGEIHAMEPRIGSRSTAW